MVPSTNTQLGKLLASYLSTSNDALAIHSRKHYSPTISPTSPRKPKAKRVKKEIVQLPPERYIPKFYKISTTLLYIFITLVIGSIFIKIKIQK